MRPKKRTLWLLRWYDIEGDSGWGTGATKLPQVVEPCFILRWPDPDDEIPCYGICHAWAEEEAGTPCLIPAHLVPKPPKKICDVKVKYR